MELDICRTCRKKKKLNRFGYCRACTQAHNSSKPKVVFPEQLQDIPYEKQNALVLISRIRRVSGAI